MFWNANRPSRPSPRHVSTGIVQEPKRALDLLPTRGEVRGPKGRPEGYERIGSSRSSP